MINYIVDYMTAIQTKKLATILQKTVENGEFILYQEAKRGVLRKKGKLFILKAKKKIE